MLRRRRAEKERTGTPADLLVVGLGNPGSKYEGTRHNVGVAVLEVLADRHDGRLRKGKELALVGEIRIDGSRVALAFPQTFMNESGRAVVELVRRYGIGDLERLVVVHDELDLPAGRVKVKLGGGLAGHNGLKSIRNHLHDDNFGRVRVGVGREGGQARGANYVLSRPRGGEREEIDIGTVEAADAVEMILDQGYEAAMNRFNAGR
ncbi:MAG: aminoacyl-tRNA hydrolase [Acidimicrobiales bacterium]